MIVGTVRQLGRFPVKSMQGESPSSVRLETPGVVGDRTHGLIDVETGKVACAKDPRRWSALLQCRAVHAGEPGAGDGFVFTLPDGSEVLSRDAEAEAKLSAALGRQVRLASQVGDAGYDYVWEVDGIAPDEVIEGSRTGTTDEGHAVSTMPLAFMAPGTFQDVAPITLMTTAALAAMAGHHPGGDWSPERFRSNLLLDVPGESVVENDWVERRLRIGTAELEVIARAPRCVMTTLAQPGLERDREILRTVARHNRQEFAGMGQWACLGAYASVVTPGDVSVGDEVELVD